MVFKLELLARSFLNKTRFKLFQFHVCSGFEYTGKKKTNNFNTFILNVHITMNNTMNLLTDSNGN